MVWSDRNIQIKSSEEDINLALKKKTIKNRFALASFDNTGLKINYWKY
jgi:hypothetical protein